MMPHMQVDRGAVKYIMSGAHVMCRGLTSPGGRMDNVEKDTIVVRTVVLIDCKRQLWWKENNML